MTKRSRWLLGALLTAAVSAVLLTSDVAAPRVDATSAPARALAPAVSAERQPPPTLRAPPPAATATLEAPRRAGGPHQALNAIAKDAPNVVVLDPGALLGLPLGRLLLRCLAQSPAVHVPQPDFTRVERLAFAQLADGRRLSVASGELNARSGPTRKKLENAGGDELWLQGDDDEVVRGAVERATSQEAAPAIDPNDDYGDAHGRLDANLASRLLPPALAEKVRQAGLQFAFHLDATDGVQLTIDATGPAEAAREISGAIRATLEEMRQDARQERELTLGRLLDAYTLHDTPDGFQLEATLPYELSVELLENCVAGAASGP